MKKIFILTGEPSGDKLASSVISKLKKLNSDIQYLCVGGKHLNSLGIKSLYELKEITYIAFTDVLLNIFKIKKKINQTVEKILEFQPDILFSVDSPDFTLRVAKKVKKINPNIKTIHFIAPKVWAWREGRVHGRLQFLRRRAPAADAPILRARRRRPRARAPGRPTSRGAAARPCRTGAPSPRTS